MKRYNSSGRSRFVRFGISRNTYSLRNYRGGTRL